jgi:signal transduction histidine kinase
MIDPAGTELRLLLVEDSEFDRDLMLLKLQQAGFAPNALCVDTLDELEAALRDFEWQIVLSDFDLPGFNGLRALEMVRQRDPDTPFFIISGVIDEEQAVSVMKAGAQDYFFKGKLARLGPAVQRELKEAEQRRIRKAAQEAIDRDRKVLKHDRIRSADILSHELRTPLNIINMAATMLDRYEDRMDASTRRERIGEIKDAIARMTRIIDKVLLASRLELRRWELRSEVLDLEEWCRDFLAHTAVDASERDRIRLSLSAVPATVALDPRILEIALQNVLSNALKYSGPDEPVQLEIRGDTPGCICFVVRDRGIGVPEADQAHVLDSFYRGSNVGNVQGTGLGLAIVKACMEVHGGSIRIDSGPGEGTAVTMTLPDWCQLRHATQVSLQETEVIHA